jgi:hypothetical protein
MRACIVRILADDGPIAEYRPADPSRVDVIVRMLVGPCGAAGEESFDVRVLSVAMLADELGGSGRVVDGRHTLLVREWSGSALIEYLERAVSACVADRWESLAEKLARIGAWEFEDYKPFGRT